MLLLINVEFVVRWTALAVFGMVFTCIFNFPVIQATVISGSNSQGYEATENAAALEFEDLLQDYLEQMRDLKALLHRYIANSPPNFRKRAQFLRLGR